MLALKGKEIFKYKIKKKNAENNENSVELDSA